MATLLQWIRYGYKINENAKKKDVTTSSKCTCTFADTIQKCSIFICHSYLCECKEIVGVITLQTVYVNGKFCSDWMDAIDGKMYIIRLKWSLHWEKKWTQEEIEYHQSVNTSNNKNQNFNVNERLKCNHIFF